MQDAHQKGVKASNKSILYECMRRNCQITLASLMEITKLSRPTVTSLVRELQEEGLIYCNGYDSSNVGRSPALYSISPNAAYAIGIDFDFPFSRTAISNLIGMKCISSHLKYPRHYITEDAMQRLMQQVEDLIIDSHIPQDRILGIGLGMPGTVDIKKGKSIILERISDWKDYPVSSILERRFGLPVYMKNDVHALTYAERNQWSEKEFSDTLFVSIRSGIGMAVVMNGFVLNGEYGNTGFLGHTIVNIDGPRCSCGKRGCLELYCSEPAILDKYCEWTDDNLDSVTTIIERANEHDVNAVRVLEYAGYHFGIGLVNAALVFDITRIVVNAQFDTKIMLKSAQHVLDENINQYRTEGRISLFTGRLKESDYALGACLMVIEQSDIVSRVNSNR